MEAIGAADTADADPKAELDLRELADETLRFQSKVDGAFLTGQQDDCPGCTSVVPLEGLAAVYRAKATPRLRAALEHGLRFVEQRSHLDVGGQRAPSLLGQRLDRHLDVLHHLLAGGGGFIGSHMADAFLARLALSLGPQR